MLNVSTKLEKRTIVRLAVFGDDLFFVFVSIVFVKLVSS